jgi:hypothetical protein
MTLSPNPYATLVRHQNTRDTTKPAWRAPVCRPEPLLAVTQFSTIGFDDSISIS